jgi:hypothetical protein
MALVHAKLNMLNNNVTDLTTDMALVKSETKKILDSLKELREWISYLRFGEDS